jgi:hypothetical protein
MPPPKRTLPPFLAGNVKPLAYTAWLEKKAAAHARRDQRRWEKWKSGADYRDLIHAAVVESKGKDAYTGEDLDWSLIGKYNNNESKAGRHKYKAEFALLPTVDHIESDNPDTAFCICGWRTNDAKHDLSTASFIELCERVLKHHGFTVTKDA